MGWLWIILDGDDDDVDDDDGDDGDGDDDDGDDNDDDATVRKYCYAAYT